MNHAAWHGLLPRDPLLESEPSPGAAHHDRNAPERGSHELQLSGEIREAFPVFAGEFY